MHVRKQVALAVAAAISLSAFMPTLSAAPLVLSDGDTIKLESLGSGGSYQSGSGGEFLWTGVSIANGSSGSFISFCVEENQYISPGSTYTVQVNTGAVSGGLGTTGTYSGDVNGSATFDPLSNATAWLYTQYLTNTAALSGFGSYSVANAGDVQNAIWFLENETTAALTGNALIWMNQAVAAAQGGYTNPYVYVLNLGADSGNQDQLYMGPSPTITTSVPEPETYAMLLAGLGLLGFAARRRKLKEATAA